MHITIDSLSKIYKNGHKALDNVSLEIESGMFGLLGPNGAGKSSLMRILVTLQEYSAGSISINGLDINKDRSEVRKLIGYLPQDFTYFSKLKTWEFLDYAAKLAGNRVNKVDEMLEKVGLYEVRDKLANNLSGGMKRRLGIAQALITDPGVLVIDEPTTGLDPEERIRFRNILSDLSEQDVAIILSTHIVGDISSTCNNMALLHKGSVAFNGSPEALIAKVEGKVWQLEVDDMAYNTIKVNHPVVSTIPSSGKWEIQVLAESLAGYDAINIKPNLEHAYVYFLENDLKISLR